MNLHLKECLVAQIKQHALFDVAIAIIDLILISLISCNKIMHSMHVLFDKYLLLLYTTVLEQEGVMQIIINYYDTSYIGLLDVSQDWIIYHAY